MFKNAQVTFVVVWVVLGVREMALKQADVWALTLQMSASPHGTVLDGALCRCNSLPIHCQLQDQSLELQSLLLAESSENKGDCMVVLFCSSHTKTFLETFSVTCGRVSTLKRIEGIYMITQTFRMTVL